jgi:AcrR family transcriptional regulator
VLPIRNDVSVYDELREKAQTDLRESVITVAENLLTSAGAEAVTVRNIAQQLGCSTKVIYTLFEGKNGLTSALFQRGFERLKIRWQQIERQADAAATLQQVGQIYWQYALDFPGLYGLMFGTAFIEFVPDEAAQRAYLGARDDLIAVMQHYIEHQQLLAENPVTMAKSFWAALHGAVILVLTHRIEPDEGQQVYTLTLQTLIRGLLRN